MRLPDAAALLQEHLEALPALVSSLEVRLIGAEEAVVNRNASRGTLRAAADVLISEERTFWMERARVREAQTGSDKRSTGVERGAETEPAVESASVRRRHRSFSV